MSDLRRGTNEIRNLKREARGHPNSRSSGMADTGDQTAKAVVGMKLVGAGTRATVAGVDDLGSNGSRLASAFHGMPHGAIEGGG